MCLPLTDLIAMEMVVVQWRWWWCGGVNGGGRGLDERERRDGVCAGRCAGCLYHMPVFEAVNVNWEIIYYFSF
ncbi:hypothetical protein Hdeb2414_s0006g00207761 [Helianthus debilis subsp. tardiflorus]